MVKIIEIRPHCCHTQTVQSYSPDGTNVPVVPPCNTCLLQPTRVHNQNSISKHGPCTQAANTGVRHLLTSREHGWCSRAVITGSVFRASMSTANVHGPRLQSPVHRPCSRLHRIHYPRSKPMITSSVYRA